MGVWIETLKILTLLLILLVTPFVGVWIETVDASVSLQKSQVTPFVGVWIETHVGIDRNLFKTSHPSWVCGLKP